MWRHEDVWRTLGGGIDFVTGERLTDEWQQAKAGKDYGLIRLCLPPLIHGAAQWAVLGALFSGSTVVLVPQVRPRRDLAGDRAAKRSRSPSSPATRWAGR